MTVSLPSTQTPLGYGVSPPSLLGPPSPLLADKIDPKTHDFESLFEGRHPVEAAVLLAFSIVRGSGAAVVNVGHRFHTIRKILPSIQNEIDSKAREALGLLIKNRDIQYRGVELTVHDESNQTVEAVVKWVNLRAMDGRMLRTQVPFEVNS